MGRGGPNLELLMESFDSRLEDLKTPPPPRIGCYHGELTLDLKTLLLLMEEVHTVETRLCTAFQ